MVDMWRHKVVCDDFYDMSVREKNREKVKEWDKATRVTK